MNGLTKPFARSLLLALIFAACLCLLGPVGTASQDSLSQWLLSQSGLDRADTQGLSGAATTPADAVAGPLFFAFVEWATAPLAAGLAVLITARLAAPVALAAGGLLALLILLLPLLVFLASGALMTSSVPLLALAFGMLCTWAMTTLPAANRSGSFSKPSGTGAGGAAPSVGSTLPVPGQALESNPPPTAALSGGHPDTGEASSRPQTLGTIGRYEIIRTVGKGAMGEVFLGRDPHINRLTAIKTLHFEDTFAKEEIAPIRAKFFREAESAGALSHPHIVTIYDAGEDGSTAYIAMEFLEGTTLLQFARRKHLLPLRRLIGYMVQVADALDYAHSQGVIHRDIKPANLILIPSGHIKITDFGIARIATSSQTQTGVVKGTPYYMSPEQFSGQKVDGRSDIFSLGTTMFQLLTGTLPFYAESPALLMNQIMNFPHPNPRAINPRIVPAMIAVVDKALQKDRRQRYQTAREVAVALRRLDKRIKTALRQRRAMSVHVR